MQCRLTALAFLGLVAMAVPALAQPHPLRGPEPNGTTEPDQPVRQQNPTLTPRNQLQPIGPQPGQQGQYPQAQQYPAQQGQYPQGQQQQPVERVQQPPKLPFPPLTPQQEAQVDRILNQWEKRNSEVKTFDCKFKRWIYDSVFGTLDKPMFVELGAIKFAAPDKGLFRIETSEKDGKLTPIEDARADHWMSDGKAIYEYSPTKKQVIEHKLPPELQGKAIANTPLPFLFGAQAQKLKQRYFIHIVTPSDVRDQVWLEAYPRSQQDAGNFQRAQFIITMQGMSPFALKLVQPNGKDYTVYQFYDIVMNDRFVIFKSDPFRVFVPHGWQLIPDQQPAQANLCAERRTAISVCELFCFSLLLPQSVGCVKRTIRRGLWRVSRTLRI